MDHPNGQWRTVISDWTNASGDLVSVTSTKPNALGIGGAYSQAIIRLNSAYRVKFQASVPTYAMTANLKVRGLLAIDESFTPTNFATDRTIEVVPISQGATPGYAVLSHNATGRAVALHSIYGHMNVAGTVQVHHDSDGAGGGTPVVLIGAMNVAGTGKVDKDFGPNPDFCPKTTAVVGRHLTVLTVGGALNGVAVISSAK
jgi:hypothetical protein